MPDDRFTQSTLHAPRADQSEAIATYKSGAHLLNYAYSGRHSGVATIDALLPEQDGFSVWNTTAAGTIIPFSFMEPHCDISTRILMQIPQTQRHVVFMNLTFWN